MNLDALVEDIDLNELENKKTTNKKPTTQKPTTVTSGNNNTNKLVSSEIKPFLAATANVPKEYREKWTKMNRIDINSDFPSIFLPSYSYRQWDVTTQSSNINKCFQEIVKNAGVLSELNEMKITKLLLLINPVTDSDNGNRLNKAFFKQLLLDLKNEIKNDCNYNENKFKSLAKALDDSN